MAIFCKVRSYKNEKTPFFSYLTLFGVICDGRVISFVLCRLLRYLTNRFGRISCDHSHWGYVFGDDASGPDNGSLTNGHAGKDNDI